MLEVLFEDQELVVINKPAGLLVHKTALAYGEEENALIQLRNQIGSWVAPVHRLDRATSGCLLFAKNEQVLPKLQGMFMERKIQKTYHCLVRGIPSEKHGVIDYPLQSERSGKLQEAQSKFKVLAEIEKPFNSTGRYPTSRYSLLEIELLTGRTHQIRRHLAHIRHYILGDRKHGDNKQNHYFETHFGLEHLLLHAWKLRFEHPISGKLISVACALPPHFQHIVEKLGWNLAEINLAGASSPTFDLL